MRSKFSLHKHFKRKEGMEERASGVDVEYTERKSTAEEMRLKETERFGETRKRHAEENEKLVTPERKWRRNSDVMEVLKESIQVKRTERAATSKAIDRKRTKVINMLYM